MVYWLCRGTTQSEHPGRTLKEVRQNLREAVKLIIKPNRELAEKKKKTLMVDHAFLYTEAARKMKEIIQRGEIPFNLLHIK
jgi:hypothetical protein